MGSTNDKIKRVANQAGGKIKEGVGKAIGNEQMQVEGHGSAGQRQGAAEGRRSQVHHQGRSRQGRRQSAQEALRLHLFYWLVPDRGF